MVRARNRGQYANSLDEYITKWLDSHNTNWDWLIRESGAAGGTGTRIAQGRIPWPETLKKLAGPMEVSPAKLLLLAGYLTEEDLILAGEPGLTQEEQELIDHYRSLDETAQEQLLENARGLRKVWNKAMSLFTNPIAFMPLPLLFIIAALVGGGTATVVAVETGLMEHPKYWVNGVDTYFREGLAAKREKQWLAALKSYNAALAKDPTRVDIRVERGFVRSMSGDKRGAIPDLVEGLRNPTATDFYQGFSYFWLADLTGNQPAHLILAIRAFDRSIMKHSENPDAWVLRGVTKRELVEQGVYNDSRLADAIADIEQAIVLDPDYQDAYLELEETRRLMGE